MIGIGALIVCGVAVVGGIAIIAASLYAYACIGPEMKQRSAARNGYY